MHSAELATEDLVVRLHAANSHVNMNRWIAAVIAARLGLLSVRIVLVRLF